MEDSCKDTEKAGIDNGQGMVLWLVGWVRTSDSSPESQYVMIC